MRHTSLENFLLTNLKRSALVLHVLCEETRASAKTTTVICDIAGVVRIRTVPVTLYIVLYLLVMQRIARASNNVFGRRSIPRRSRRLNTTSRRQQQARMPPKQRAKRIRTFYRPHRLFSSSAVDEKYAEYVKCEETMKHPYQIRVKDTRGHEGIRRDAT